MNAQYVFLIALGGLFALTLILTLRHQVDLRHSLLWLICLMGAMAICVDPEPFYELSSVLGFMFPSNAVFSIAILMLTTVVYFQTISIGRAKKDIRRLTQDIAIYEARRSQQAESQQAASQDQQKTTPEDGAPDA